MVNLFSKPWPVKKKNCRNLDTVLYMLWEPKFDIWFRLRLCRNWLLSRNFGRNRNIGYSFGRNCLFCQIFQVIRFHLIPIDPYWPLVIWEGFRLPQTPLRDKHLCIYREGQTFLQIRGKQTIFTICGGQKIFHQGGEGQTFYTTFEFRTAHF